MSSQAPARHRAIALVGPYGSGKSTLFDALFAAAGSPVRRTEKGGRSIGTDVRIGCCTYLGDPWTILDCPGSIESSFETAAALSVVDLAVVVCDPAPSRAMTVMPLLKQLDDQGIPHLVFVNRIDTLEGHVRDTLTALQAYSARPLLLRQVPIREGETVTGYVDVASERAYRYRKGMPSELIQLPSEMHEREKEARDGFLEVLADHDDALLEKILEDVQPTAAEVFEQLRRDQVAGNVVEVLLGAAQHEHGVRRLWKALRHDTPASLDTAARRGVTPDDGVLAQVFKTQHAGHTGKLSYVRVWRGRVTDGMTLGGARVGGIYRVSNGETQKIAEAQEGEIVALGRLETIATGATLAANGAAEALPFPESLEPVYALAIAAQDRKDDVRLSGALQKLIEEDPSLSILRNPETGETILRGQGELHLNAAIERIAEAYNIRVSSRRPEVAYKETIRKAVHQHGRLKRQTGGHGQFADVKIDIAPRARGEGFSFINRIVGGAVPRQYIPAVGEAAQEAAKKGPFGHPVVDIEVTLVDGTFHSVDSSDMAFKSATRIAMTEGLAKADPVVLEPIHAVTATVPNEYTARAQRILTGRHGQILGYAEKPGWTGWDNVEALVPESELHDLIIELRSQTMGLGTYAHRFDHLAEHRGQVERAAV